MQKQIPVIHPVLDYSYTFGQPVFGGELGYRINLTSLSRSGPRRSIRSPSTAIATGSCAPDQRRSGGEDSRQLPAARHSGNLLALLRGDAVEAQLSPIRSARCSRRSPRCAAMPRRCRSSPSPASPTICRPATAPSSARMPTVGLEYRYPFINVQSWGTQTIEPIAQIIVRPNEPSIGKLPNEDSQSLIFDDSNLFKVDKFSGWDRVEGGGRANVGVQYTAQFNRGGFVNALFGQSYQLFGTNSFAVGDTTNTGLDSGLDTNASDYVARVVLPAGPHLHLHHALSLRPGDLRAAPLRGRGAAPTSTAGRVSVLYGNYDAQPLLGFLQRREGILGTASRQADRQLGRQRRAALRHRRRQDRPDPVRHRLYRRLPHSGPELHHQLHLQRQPDPRSQDHAATEPAHAGRHVVRPDCRQHPGGL